MVMFADLGLLILVGLSVVIYIILACFYPELFFGFPNPPVSFFSGSHTHQFGLDPTEIEAFPLFQYSKGKELEIGRVVTMVECAMCLGEFEEAETLRLLPKCNHVFHQQCIDKWLALHVTCPVCRAILSPETDADSDGGRT